MSRRHAPRVIALATVAFTLACADEGSFTLPLPSALQLDQLGAEQRALLRAEIDAPGLLPRTELAFNEERTALSGAFVVEVLEPHTVPVTIRVFGRFAAETPEVLLALSRTDVAFAPRERTQLAPADDAWVSDGAPAYDANGNGRSNITDLIDGFDPAPGRVLDVSPAELQFPSGVQPGDRVRQIVVVENVSGLPQMLTPAIVGAQGVSITRVDATGTPEAGAPRELAPIVLQPFQEVLLAVTFAPTNAFLVRGGVGLAAVQADGVDATADSDVMSGAEVELFANSDGNPQPVVEGYAPTAADVSALGLDPAKVPSLVYPGRQLFGGQPIAPGNVRLSDDDADVVVVPGLGVSGQAVGGIPASLVFALDVPPRHRASAVLSDVGADVQLGIFFLDGAGAALTGADEHELSTGAGTSVEHVQLRNFSPTETRRAVIVLGRVDPRDDDGPLAPLELPFALLAQLTAGPEFDPSGDAISSDGTTFVRQLSGAFRGGEHVELRGISFSAGATVRFGAHTADPTRTTVHDDGARIVTITPPADTGDIGKKLDVIAINPNGEAAVLPDGFAYDPPAPVVDDVDPPVGSTVDPTPILVTGAYFSTDNGGPRVLIDDVPATDVTVLAPGLLTAVAPTHAAGFTTLAVVNVGADGDEARSNAFPFVFVAPEGAAPAITSVTPDTGDIGGGEPVTIEGSDFVDGALVRFGGSLAQGVVVADATTVYCIAPPGIADGAVDVIVTNLDGQSAVAADAFSYQTPAPVLLLATPDTVSTLGGTRQSLQGTGFRPGATAAFRQGGDERAALNVLFLSSTALSITAPAGLAAGNAAVVVTNPAPNADSSAELPITVVAPTAAPPRILALDPASVRTDTLGTITVTGTGFQAGMLGAVDDVAVTLQGITASSFTFSAPGHAVGAAILRVTNPDGQTDAAVLTYQDALDPVLGVVAPEFVGALVPGDVITVSGANLPALADDNVELRDGTGALYDTTLLSSTASSLRLQIDAALPERDDYRVVADLAPPPSSSTFAAFGPSVFTQQVVSGQPIVGSALSVLVSGANLNATRITGMRFTRDDDAVFNAAVAVRTSTLVRADVAGSLLPQGTYEVALVWAFTLGGTPTELVVPAPNTLVIGGDCGNAVVDAGEECDSDNLDGLVCDDVGFFGGTLRCTASCTLNTGACTNCGNGLLDDPLEECDGANLGGVSCQDLDVDFTGGTPTCTSTCVLSAATCSQCGNGIVESGEQCDGNNLDNESCASLGLGLTSGQLACRGDCAFETQQCDTCGDGRCGASEDRDCSPSFPGCTVCTADCASTCGDGACQTGGGESCQACPRDCSSLCNPPFTLSVTSGGGQSQRLSADLGSPVVFRVLDGVGAPLVGAQLVLTPPPGGAVAPATPFTDATGFASAIFTAPRATGVHQFTASGSGPDGTVLANAPLSVTVTALDLAPGAIQTLVNHVGASGRTALLDGSNNPTPVAGTKARINLDGVSASGIVAAADGTLFLSDTTNHRVVRLDPSGLLHHVAGSNIGSAGFSGDNGPARTALLNTPRGLALDAAGHLYIADATNHRVRRVDATTGVITTVAGGGTETVDNVLATTALLSNPSAVLVNLAGEMFIQNNWSQYNIRRVSPAGLITTVVSPGNCDATVRASSLNETQLALDPQGRLLFIGYVNNGGGCPIVPYVEHVLRRESNGTLTTVAGGSTAVSTGAARGAQLNDPTGLAADAAGNIYIGERSGRRIRRVSPLGVISTIIGTGASGNSGDGGPASNAQLAQPAFLAVTPTGDLVFGDGTNHNLRIVRDILEDTPPSVVVTLVGNGQSAALNQALPAALGLHVEDSGGSPVAGVDLIISPSAGAAAEPAAASTDASGNATFVGFVGRAPGSYTFQVSAIGPNALPLPGSPFTLTATATDVAPGTIFALVNQSGTQGASAAGGSAARMQLSSDAQTFGVVVDPDDGTLYLADTYNHRILRVAPSGLVTQIAGTGSYGRGSNGPALTVALYNPRGLALEDDTVNGRKNLYIADTNNDYVRVLLGAEQDCAPNGCALNIFAGNNLNDANVADGIVATGANLDDPTSVALGPDGDVFIVDQSHTRVRRVDTDPLQPGVPGMISSAVVGATCTTNNLRIYSFDDSALAFDGSGRMYMSGYVYSGGSCPAPNGYEHYVVRLELDGTQSIVAGGSIERTSGPAYDTDLDYPSGLAVDPAGNLFIAENSSHRVRRVDVLGRMTVVAGDGVAGLSGNGGPASAARLSSPTALAFDAEGNLIIADGGNRSVRAIRAIASATPDTATLSIVDGDAQVGITGQLLTATGGVPLRVNLAGAGGADLGSIPVTFTALDPGDTVTLPVVSTNLDGEAQTDARLGRSPAGPHRVTASARTWLDPTDVIGSPRTFTLSAALPNSGGTFAIVNSTAQPGAIPAIGDSNSLAATEARLNLTSAGVAVTSDGTLFVADTNNHRVLAVSPEGMVSVFAGTGTQGLIDNVSATTAQLDTPRGLALDDDGNLFIVDAGGAANRDRVRRVDAISGGITTVVGGAADTAGHGTGALGSPAPGNGVNLNDPVGIAFNPVDGLLYVVDPGHNMLIRAHPTSGDTELVNQGAGCTSATGIIPNDYGSTGVAFDGTGRAYFIATVWDSGGCPPPAALYQPNLLRRETDGTFTFLAGTGTSNGTTNGDGVTGSSLRIDGYAGSMVMVGNDLVYADPNQDRVRRIPNITTTPGGVISILGALNTAGFASLTQAPSVALTNWPWGLAYDGATGQLFWTEDGNDAVRVLIP